MDLYGLPKRMSAHCLSMLTFTQTRKDLRAIQLKSIKTHLALFDNYLSKQMQ